VNTVRKSVDAVLQAGDDPGTFEAIISTGSVDREGEIVSPDSWELPLPDQISLNLNHSSSVEDVVGSGTPWLDELGQLRLSGKWASTAQAQKARTLTSEGHLRSLSVEFLRKGKVNELVGCALVLLPANKDAVMLSSKQFNDELQRVIKAAGSSDGAMVQAIHDASSHLGAVCIAVPADDDDLSEDGSDGASDGSNKSLQAKALRLRLKALSR
jgi:hypothetical protein